MKVCGKITYAELLQILSKADFPTLDIHKFDEANLCITQSVFSAESSSRQPNMPVCGVFKGLVINNTHTLQGILALTQGFLTSLEPAVPYLGCYLGVSLVAK